MHYVDAIFECLQHVLNVNGEMLQKNVSSNSIFDTFDAQNTASACCNLNPTELFIIQNKYFLCNYYHLCLID